MKEIYKDSAGNKLLQDPISGRYEARNAEGKLVNKEGFKTLATKAGMPGEFRTKLKKKI